MDVYQEAEQLRQVPMFSKLDASRLKLLAFTCDAVTFKDGENLFHANDPADSAFVILKGEVEVMSDASNGESIPIVNLKPNALIGEMAVLSNSPRSATLRAKGSVTTLRIASDLFLKLVTDNPDVALDVMRQLCGKLGKSHSQVEELQAELSSFK